MIKKIIAPSSSGKNIAYFQYDTLKRVYTRLISVTIQIHSSTIFHWYYQKINKLHICTILLFIGRHLNKRSSISYMNAAIVYEYLS